MDVLVDLLPPSFSAKTEPLAKDNRQKRQGQHKALSNSMSSDNDGEVSNIQTRVNVERRTGDDRRAQEMNRGRWLDSRDRNGRRANSAAICVKI